MSEAFENAPVLLTKEDSTRQIIDGKYLIYLGTPTRKLSF